jgi:hypothetical protein
MDGLIVIRSVMLANHMAGTRLLMVSWLIITGLQEGRGQDTAITPKTTNGYKDPVLIAGWMKEYPQD